jgi:multimeric flavodoxin WrbA
MARVLVLYHSQEFGNTAAMAAAVADGAREAGADIELVNTNDWRLDIETYRAADAAAFGSPDYYSYIAGGLKMFLDDWFIAKEGGDPARLTGKPYGLFYSHGGGGAVRQPLEKLFAGMGTQVGVTIESRGKPDDEVLAACRDLGRELAEVAGQGGRE